MDDREWLFAYGTLAPDGPDSAARGGWEEDAVQGWLYDFGPHPGLVVDALAGWVEGFVCKAGSIDLAGRLDAYEGVKEGLFRRVRVMTRRGREVWVYEFARAIPAGARGPLGRWEGARYGLDAPERAGSDRA